MARLRIMYWKEIPVQVQAEDESGRVSMQLAPRFQEGVDAIAMFDGSAGSDEYLMSWEWGGFREVGGTPQEAVEALANRFDTEFPVDFVARIRDLHREGRRDPRPGAIDAWMDER